MTTVREARPTERSGPGALGRVRALAAAETRLLWRNRTAVVNSVLAPLLLVAAVRARRAGANAPSLAPLPLVHRVAEQILVAQVVIVARGIDHDRAPVRDRAIRRRPDVSVVAPGIDDQKCVGVDVAIVGAAGQFEHAP